VTGTILGMARALISWALVLSFAVSAPAEARHRVLIPTAQEEFHNDESQESTGAEEPPPVAGEGWAWLHAPAQWVHHPARGLAITTKAETDFWQRTHYGFRRDDGHFLSIAQASPAGFYTPPLALSVHTRFTPRQQYDQCGLMVRLDAENWLKLSLEAEDENRSRLGSVATNHGYSDWAFTEVPASVTEVTFRLSHEGDFWRFEYAVPGADWREMRITPLLRERDFETIHIGVYAASPTGDAFTCTFDELELTDSVEEGAGDSSAAHSTSTTEL